MHRALVALAIAAAPASAEPTDLVARPLALDCGGVRASLAIELGLDRARTGYPVSLAPDAWIGVTSRWTIGLVHSNRSLDQVDARSSLCLRGSSLTCEHVYRGGGVDALWSWRTGPLAVAPRARLLVRDVEPWKPAVTVGALARWTRGRYAIETDPYLRLGLANRDAGNRAKLVVPIWLALQPIERWKLALHTGWDGELATWRDGWHVPIGVEVVGRVTERVELVVGAGFPHLLGPQNDYKQRSMAIAVAYVY